MIEHVRSAIITVLMAKKNICAFSTADDKYAISSALSLLSVRKHAPDTDLFIIGKKYSAKTKKLLKKYNVTPIEINLNDKFYKAWDYPIECYYIFAGPEILHDKGYSYSVYVDGDVYCNNNPFTLALSEVKDFAGTFTRSTIEAILGKDATIATSLYGNASTLLEPRIQTGIVYFNNTSLARKKFLNKIASVYKTAIENDIPRKGDDSLLALFRLAYPNWSYLDLGDFYNKVSPGIKSVPKEDWIHLDSEMISGGVFMHFTNHTKPWKNTSRFPSYTHEYFYHAWRRHAIDTLNDSELLEYYPDIHATLSDDHLKFYWYPTKNVGDLITPFFLEDVCGVKDLSKYSITEHGIRNAERKNVGLRTIVKQLPKRVANKVTKLSRKIRKKVYTPYYSDLEPTYVPTRRARYAVSTGSVIRLCQDHAMVYGSGIRDVQQTVHHSMVRAVRGPLTRQRFLDSGFPCAPIYGDPGLLMPRFYKAKQPKTKYKLGLIPHFTEYDDIVEKYANDKDVLVIDMNTGNLKGVIDQINMCDKTVSSSLHGLVLSHAYGVPTRQIEYSDRINGDGTKFLDYYKGVGLERLDPIDGHGCKYISANTLLSYDFEKLVGYDDSKLLNAMFFNESGFRPSARYPYA